MIEHPDHTGASSNPHAPWNQGDPDPVICPVCDHEPQEGAEEGAQCESWYDDVTGGVVADGTTGSSRCEGRYESTRCTNCNELACRCDP